MTTPTPSLPEVRRLCATLATGRRAAEIGTLYGDGAAAIAATAVSLVTVDGGGEETKTDPSVLDLLAPGGIAVLDDQAPGRAGPDPVRELWLGDPRLVSVEILTTPATAAIVAVRR